MIGEQNNLPRVALGSQFSACNLGKRSLSLDVKHPESMAVILALLERCDVFLANFTQRALDDLGLSYASLKVRNPRLIYAVCSGFGPTGPLAGKKGFDGAAQARGGILSITGTEDMPVLSGDATADTGGAIQLALGIMTALLARERFGVGQEVKTSLYGSQLWSQRWSITHVGMTGAKLSRQGQYAYTPSPGANGVYKTRDGNALVLIFPIVGRDPDAAWRALCDFGQRPELGTDPRFATGHRRGMAENVIEDRLAFREGLVDIFASHTLASWEEWFSAQPDFVWSPMRTHNETLEEEQALANDYIVSVNFPHLGAKKVVGNVVHLSETPGKVRGPPPLIGADTKSIMQELGFNDASITQVMKHTKDVMLQQSNEKVAKKITKHISEYWDEE